MSSFQFPLNVLSDGCFVATNKTGIMLKPHFKVRSCEISENKNHKHKTVAANFCCGFYPFELFGYFLTLLCIRAARSRIWALLSFNSRRKICASALQCWDNKRPTWLPYFKHSSLSHKPTMYFKETQAISHTNTILTVSQKWLLAPTTKLL